MQRNDSDLATPLDVNHFRPIVERHWDAIFAERFGYDQTIPGTLSWITRARNNVAHPGTSDMSNSDAQGHFSNILKILRRINAIDASTAIEQIRRQRLSRNPSPSVAPNISTQPATANSSSANIRGQNINKYQHKDLGLALKIIKFFLKHVVRRVVGIAFALLVSMFVLYMIGAGAFRTAHEHRWLADGCVGRSMLLGFGFG